MPFFDLWAPAGNACTLLVVFRTHTNRRRTDVSTPSSSSNLPPHLHYRSFPIKSNVPTIFAPFLLMGNLCNSSTEGAHKKGEDLCGVWVLEER